MKLLLLIACCALPAIIAATHVHRCPCATGEGGRANKPRAKGIRDDMRDENKPDIYSALVIGKVCNCDATWNGTHQWIGSRGFPGLDQLLYCIAYSVREDDNTSVASTLVSGGFCEDDNSPCLQECPNGIAATGMNVEALPPLVNLTTGNEFGRPPCNFSCPFNYDSEDYGLDFNLDNAYPEREFGPEIQACFYTVKVTEVFKGGLTNGAVLNVTGPIGKTSCGEPNDRVMSIGEEYIVGLGGPRACHAIDSWSTLSSFSAQEITCLRNKGSGAICYSHTEFLPLIILPFVVVAILLSVVAACLYCLCCRGLCKRDSPDTGNILEKTDKG